MNMRGYLEAPQAKINLCYSTVKKANFRSIVKLRKFKLWIRTVVSFHTHTSSVCVFHSTYTFHVQFFFYLGFSLLNMQNTFTQRLKAHFKHLKRKKCWCFHSRLLYFPLCCWSGSGVRYDCNVVETEATVKAPVIGCRLHRDQQMEGRGAACILKV